MTIIAKTEDRLQGGSLHAVALWRLPSRSVGCIQGFRQRRWFATLLRGPALFGQIAPLRLAIWLALLVPVIAARPANAQEDKAQAAKQPQLVTTADPTISTEQLTWLVKPLTCEELTVEASGWRDLLKAKVQQIADRQVQVKEEKEVARRVESRAAADTEQQSPGGAAGEDDKAEPKEVDAQTADADQARVDQAEAVAEQLEEHRQDVAASLPELRDEQAALVKRLNVVIDALEEKGGDVESYRKYIRAVSAIELDASDARTAWTLVQGWLVSQEGGQRWLWNFARFLLIAVSFYFAASIVSRLVRRGVARVKGTSLLLQKFLGKFVKQAVLAVGLVVALAALEVDIGPLLAAIGAAGFVVAFALQDTLSNFASGLLLLAYQPFDVGDVIEAAGVSGIVDSVSLFSTHIRTFDNKIMIVPNNDIWSGTITNATATDTRRVDLVFGIGYDDDVEEAKRILEQIVANHELVLENPAPVIQMHELADSSVNFICRPWTRTVSYWQVYWDIMRSVKEAFDKAGISIPYPQRDVHVFQHATDDTT